jgi:hypothetical protein
MLKEASTKDISAAVEPQNFEESKNVAQQGGNVTRQRAGIENRNKGGACIKRVMRKAFWICLKFVHL